MVSAGANSSQSQIVSVGVTSRFPKSERSMGSAGAKYSQDGFTARPVGWLLRHNVEQARKSRQRRRQVSKLEIEKLPDLAIELIARYRLLNLPFKTLFQAVWRNRSYRFLLKEQIFMRLHLERSPTSAIIYPLDCLFDAQPGKVLCIDYRHLGGDTELFNSSKITFNFVEIIPSLLEGIVPLCSSSGVVLAVDSREIPVLVCNPITRESLNLPPSQILQRVAFKEICSVPSQGVIKVLMVDTASASNITLTWWRICSLGQTNWTHLFHDIFNAPAPPQFCSNSKLHARYHWISRDTKESDMLKYFDFEREALSSLKVPYMLSGVPRSKVQVAVLDSHLCLCDHSTSNSSEIGLWLMLSYGDVLSWQKSYVIRVTDVLKDVLHNYMMMPLLTVGDNVYFVVHTHSYRYNKVSGDIAQVKFPRLDDYDWWMEYTPSNLPLSYWVKDKEKC